jgi:hypothetical protein
MEHNIDHDRFVNKNRAMADAYDTGKRDAELERRGFSRIQRQEEASCFNCKTRDKCAEFRNKRSGGTAGVVSYGGGEKFICGKFAPVTQQNKSMSDSQIKKLMKNVRKGYA